MTILIGVIIGFYAIFIFALVIAWGRLPAFNDEGNCTSSFSIIIPFRNEEDNLPQLLKALASIDYPSEKFEVIFINDHSTDQSVDIISKFTESAWFKIKCYDLEATKTGKKAALNFGISSASHDYILTTDADCSFSKNWLRSYDRIYQQVDAQMVTGPVVFYGEKSFFQKLQSMEFASLIGTGASSLQLGIPNMCNGANLSFSKSAFFAVSGYAGNDKIASGDDEFLMHKIYQQFDGKVFFNKSNDAVVNTFPLRSWRDFYHQRKRWASKWKSYGRVSTIITALFVAVFNLCMLLAYSFLLVDWSGNSWLIVPIIFKVIAEGIFLYLVMKFSGKRFYFLHFIVLELSYPFYALFFGIAANFGSYTWKGRRH